MNILVTGGAGYIGSHTCIALLKSGFSVCIIDNLCNSSASVVSRIEKLTGNEVRFFKCDVTDEIEMDKFFSQHIFDGVIHFAGLKSVGESTQKPLKYYYNNIMSTIVLLNCCKKYNVARFIFSSSATIYGEGVVPFAETAKLMSTTNPYGETKAISERILIDYSKTCDDFSVSLLRYFNPVGAHESGLIGESPNGIPNNLMPYITQVASGCLDKLKVYGNNYPTKDGTGIRDYIHVMDLAEGHVAALKELKRGAHIYNLGTGQGTSVLELVEAFENVNGLRIPYVFVDRRPGDIAICYADVTKARRELKWSAKRGIEDMVRDAWNYESKSRE